MPDRARRLDGSPAGVFLRDGTPLVIETVDADAEDSPFKRAPSTPRRYTLACANCDSDFENGVRANPYCSLGCHDIAKAVRYTRGLLSRDPGTFRHGIPYECRIKIAHALSGGYPAARRTVPESTREAVKERDGHQCVLCGEPGTDIDHIDGDANEQVNLRLLCGACHKGVTEQRLHPITDVALQQAYAAILHRVLVPLPERPCDVGNWDWRGWCLATRRAIR